MDVFRLNLELDKTRPFINEPVTFRRKDGGLGSTQIIATITDHGQTVSDIKSAVFMCIKPDYKYVRENASVSGNIITYTLNNEVGTCPGIIKTAYFQINGVVSTQNFQINVEEAISPISQSDNYDSEIQQIIKSMTNASQEEIDKFKTYLGSARNNYIYTNNGKLVLSQKNKTLTLPPNLTVTIGNNSFSCANANQAITFNKLVQFVIFNIETLQIEIKDLGTLTPNEVVLGYFDLNNNYALINIQDRFLVDDNGNSINQIFGNQIADNVISRNKLTYYNYIQIPTDSVEGSKEGLGPNLFNTSMIEFKDDPYCFVDGSSEYYSPLGKKVTTAKYLRTLKIPVKPNTTYKRNVHRAARPPFKKNNTWVTFWDKELKVITSVALMSNITDPVTSSMTDDAHRYEFTTPPNCAYVRITIQEEFINNFTFQEVIRYFDGYLDPQLYINTDHIFGLDDLKPVYQPKSVDFLGDAIIKGDETTHSFVYYFEKLFNEIGGDLTTINHGISGTTIAKSPISNSMVERFNKDLNPSDLIVILGGTNDYMQNVPISEDDESTDTSTFNGALNVMMSGLLNNFSAKIVFLTPLRAKAKYDWMSEVGDNNILKNKAGNTLRDYCDCLVKMGQKYGIEVIDWNNNLGMNPNFKASSSYYNTDLLYPNDSGHKFMAHQLYKDIAKFLVQLS